jgi:hypothetical protein
MPARAFTALSGLVLLASLFLPWYDGSAETNGTSDTLIYSAAVGTLSAWEAFSAFDILLATLAIAIVLLAFRRQATFATIFAALAVVGAATRLLWHPYDGLDVAYGIWIALAAALGALVAARGIGARE